ncbi:PVC-type heme-binding CxxCH protein [Neorhodopirellula pilleata]|uniref:Cytochrome c n=1 Tax=Neorhodopirellula pilleata TaxID=2714738 RepID=A0A5C6APZ1_9BACT|nr:PVC-type heme-binding CxxCH protein [Neorhodopirellula pilleata]TWU02103.1 Cytochrome c [Neorhodopirellula pilleata]
MKSLHFTAAPASLKKIPQVVFGPVVLALACLLPLPGIAATSLSLPAETRVAFVGNGTGQRLSLFGHLETMMHLRTTDAPLRIRNFSWPADSVAVRQRPGNYTTIDDPFAVYSPQLLICFFGMNESFDGDSPEALARFRKDYENYLDKMSEQLSTPQRSLTVVLVTPIAFEVSENPLQPDGVDENRNLAAYAEVVKQLGKDRAIAVADVFDATNKLFAEQPGLQYTVNGMHLNEAGDEAVSLLIDSQLFEGPGPKVGAERFETIREVVRDKAWLHQQDYRMLNGWYVYGGRRTWDTETFPGEYKKIRNMVAVRDQAIWDLAADRQAEPKIDDSKTGEVFIPETMFGSRDDGFRKMREPTTLNYPTPDESIAQMTVPDGFEVQCFASEKDFPELANPTQIAFDSKGRLWVSCMVNYPQWLPGKSRPSDRLLIFEDTDDDGKADRCTPFYDELICPTGFEFYKDGVLVVDEPHILFLRDTDGDDRADEVTHLLDGIATDDTHHAMGAWEYSNGGRLNMLEGIAMSTTLETPWGPIRKNGASGSYVWDLESLRIGHFKTPGQYNPWCLVFDRHGNGIIGDGTNAQHHWVNALSGGDVQSRKSLDPIFNNHGIRPAAGNEILRTRQFPEDYHNQLIFACVINMHGMPAFEIRDPEDSAGPAGERVGDLLTSTDMFFRPVDPKIGPDGALWFGDWCNALIGHMQYSQRDPNRDHEHGRIYRLRHKDHDLNDVNTQAGKTVPELLDQLTVFEPRTRYRVRRELRARSADEVFSAIGTWLAGQRDVAAQLEALWVQESFHQVDLGLASEIIAAGDFAQRAAAVNVLGNEWRFLTGNEQANQSNEIKLSTDMPLLKLLAAAADDEHPRVRLEVMRAASLMDHPAALPLALANVGKPQDKWTAYVMEHSLNALTAHWDGDSPEQQAAIASLDPAAALYLREYKIATGPGAEVYRPLKTLADVDAKKADQEVALQKIVAAGRGDNQAGAKVFERVCSACHKYGDLGKEFGPELTNLGERMNKEHIIRSIVWPNEEISKGYETVMVLTYDGEVINGFVLAETDEMIRLGVADGKIKEIEKEEIEVQKPMKASSMPEGLTETIAPSEFLDLLAFLTGNWVATNPNLDFPLRTKGDLIEVSRDSMVYIPNHWPAQYNSEAEHLMSGEGARKWDFAVHSPTANMPNQAVIIRLNEPKELVQGQIHNRGEKQFHDRATGLTMWVSDDGKQWRQVWKSEQVKPVWDFDLPAGTKAQYIKIGIEEPAILNIDRTSFYGPKG